MPISYKNVNNLKVTEDLLNFVNNELLKDTDVLPENFWLGFDKIIHELAPKNKKLIQIREDLQKKIDSWHIANRGNQIEIKKYKKLNKKNIDIVYLGAWNFKDEIFKKEKQFIKNGGKFITHIPIPKII